MQTKTYLLIAALLLAITAKPATNSTISLDGDWHFLPDPSGAAQVSQLATATGVLPTSVPSSWQAQFPDLRDYAGVAWYWRSVTVQMPAPDQIALLHFGAVDYAAQVFVNGQKVGAHEGGYLPFEFDVTSLLHTGENQVAVRVADPGTKPHDVVEGFNYAEIPHGKQNWYSQTSGLWQSVEINYRSRVRLGAVHIAAPTDGNFVITAPVLGLNLTGGATVTAEVLDATGRGLWTSSQSVSGRDDTVKLSGALHSPLLWSPSNPNLYQLRVTLSSGDSYNCRFGFRTFTTQGGKFYLNGAPIYLRGALDQDFYPDTIYSPPSSDYLRDEMRKAKALGLNLLRCHIKVPDPRYLEAADEVGLLVWYEIPNWDKLTAESERRGMETLHGMVDRDANHPCIVIASIINESWGANLKQAADRTWLKAAYAQAKSFVPWLVVDNSACCDNFHMATDIADFHQYAAVPEYASNFDRLVDDQAQRPGWLFSPYGDAEHKGDEPLMLSEFGNWGLPEVPQEKPWWFDRGFGPREITLPGGLDQRFTDYQYNSIFPDLKSLSDATQWHEFESLKYEIDALRVHPEFQGYVITEFTDVFWEANGLLDIWRHPKVFADALNQQQQDDLVVLRADQRNYRTDQQATADVYVSHYSSTDLGNAWVQWELEGTMLRGSLPVSGVGAATAGKVGTIQFPAPATAAPVKKLLKVRLMVAGKVLSENSLNLYFYPINPLDLPPAVAIYDPPPGRLRRLANDMHDRSYLAPTGSERFSVLITSAFDETVKAKLRDGGRVILIANDPLVLAPGIQVVSRRDDELSGNWISSFLWLRKAAPPFAGIGFDTLGGFETQAVTPPMVVKGIPPQSFNDVLSGIFYGWIHDSVGVLVQARAGKGKLLVCTFSLSTTYNSDPYATMLLDSLVNYAISDFSPKFELPM